MRRRDFITLAGGAVLWSAGARAQQAPRIGYLSAGTANTGYTRLTLAGLEHGLTENGMTAGRDYMLETRFAEGAYDRFPELARGLQQAKVSIILPSTIAAVRAAQQLGSPIPVVMPGINDPVGTGLIASLARPGGHTTGIATLIEDTTPKLLEFIGVLVPRANMMAVLYNPANPSNLPLLRRLRSETSARGISLSEFALKTPADLESIFASLTAHRPDALQIIPDAFVADQSDRIAMFALSQSLPTFGPATDFAQLDFLLSYGPSFRELHRRAAYYVKRIFDGTNLGDLPVEQATRIGLVINLKTANALGLTMPASLLAQAEEVVE
ncbi:MAG TPA: ABC transporter substrate-binding protein [Stellaceae bacterium]|nr:ABC transporter substrate-binding protein [Stellaceae bacterium]